MERFFLKAGFFVALWTPVFNSPPTVLMVSFNVAAVVVAATEPAVESPPICSPGKTASSCSAVRCWRPPAGGSVAIVVTAAGSAAEPPPNCCPG